MKVVLVISSMAPGGAERVISHMANYWCMKGWDVSLISLDDPSAPPFYALRGNIKLIPLGLVAESKTRLGAISNNVRRLVAMRKAVLTTAPDIVISFMLSTNVLTVLASRGLGTPIVVSERVAPSFHRPSLVWRRLSKLVYPLADALVVQTEQARASSDLPFCRVVHVIPNPVLPVSSQQEGPERAELSREFLVVAIGRLAEQKGFDILLRAFAEVLKSHQNCSLTILGEGPERGELEALRDQLGLASHVSLPGVTEDPHELLKRAGLFVLSSRYEGFPNALCEAMACGVPVIAADCSYGPAEIIRDGIDGILVQPENVTALASAMHCVMSDDRVSKRLAAKAPEIVERFGIDKVMDKWEQVIGQAMRGRVSESKEGSIYKRNDVHVK